MPDGLLYVFRVSFFELLLKDSVLHELTKPFRHSCHTVAHIGRILNVHVLQQRLHGLKLNFTYLYVPNCYRQCGLLK